MSEVVVFGGMCKCLFGKISSPIIVLPKSMVFTSSMMPVADIMQFMPIVNIPTFGMCQSPANPAVVMAAGMPVPCVPLIVSPWIPTKPNVLVKGIPILLKNSMTFCAYAGLITISNAGQFKIKA